VRILVIGAGAIGGYFGGRLLSAGRDVTFLVRPKRAEALAKDGLAIKSNRGDLQIASPRTITADRLAEPFDIILLSCKAYDLDGAIESFAPAMGNSSVIVPLLNGMRHIDVLNARFGRDRVFGGQCLISATLSNQGETLHLSDFHTLSFGEQSGVNTERANAVAETLAGANFVSQISDQILQEMWEKWVFIATGAGACSLMRASIGDMVAAGATDTIVALLDECSAVAANQGHRPRPVSVERTRAMFTAADSPLMASMLRDIERGAPTEGDHILGDLISRGAAGASLTFLRTAYLHVKSYETRRTREAAVR
jgi:2-dehydropantoate 2-reductase